MIDSWGVCVKFYEDSRKGKLLQSNLSYVTLQGKREIRSHKTGGS